MSVRTRFAPSPTGYLHIGGLRTALFNYLFAKQNKGVFVLRIEDTDQTRFIPGTKEKLITTLMNIGIHPDEGVMMEGQNIKDKGQHGPYTQSQRLDIYKKNSQILLNAEKAYPCFCTSERLKELRDKQQAEKQMPRYDGQCRHLDSSEIEIKMKAGITYVIRFKIPKNRSISVTDIVYGQISVDSNDLDDFIIMKSDGFPTYHLANVVDDHDMEITHVIRGEEWVPSLPKHILLYQALGFTAPKFVHLPLLLNIDRSKLSKRQGDVAVEDFRAKGYLRQALINYVAFLGWNPGGEREIFSLSELIKNFSLEKIHKSGAVFDITKLNWFNAEYIRKIVANGGEEFDQLVQDSVAFVAESGRTADVLRLFSSRINFLQELGEMSAWLWQLPKYTKSMLIFKKSDEQKTQLGLTMALESLKELDWKEDSLQRGLEGVVKKNKLSPGDVFWPVRVALSGQEKSPSPVELLIFFGKEESIKRVDAALREMS